jgi:hypothetical protein
MMFLSVDIEFGIIIVRFCEAIEGHTLKPLHIPQQ